MLAGVNPATVRYVVSFASGTHPSSSMTCLRYSFFLERKNQRTFMARGLTATKAVILTEKGKPALDRERPRTGRFNHWGNGLLDGSADN